MADTIQDNCFFRRSDALPQVEMRLADHSSACYSTHSHDEFSFGVIDNGAARYQNLSSTHQIGRGTTVMINPADSHSCNPDRQRWSYRMLFVDTLWLGQLQAEIFQSSQDYIPFSEHYQFSEYGYRCFSDLFDSLQGADSGIAETLLIDYLEVMFADRERRLQQSGKRDSVAVTRIRELIMDQLDSNLPLERFVEETGLSRYQLIRHFKQAYGQSPHAWQLDQRIISAKRLLQQGDSLSDVANNLGFADQAHFQRHFKKRLAITPKRYQSFFV